MEEEDSATNDRTHSLAPSLQHSLCFKIGTGRARAPASIIFVGSEPTEIEQGVALAVKFIVLECPPRNPRYCSYSDTSANE